MRRGFHGQSPIRMSTPLSSTPSSARIRMYFTPPSTLVSTKSLRSGLTRTVTSGVFTSSSLGSTRLRGAEIRVRAEGLVIPAAEGLHMLRGHAAGGQDALDRPLGDRQRLRRLTLFVLLNHGAQPALYRLDGIKGAFLLQGVGQQGVEGLPLLQSRHGDPGVKHRFHQVLPAVPRVPGIQQSAV